MDDSLFLFWFQAIMCFCKIHCQVAWMDSYRNEILREFDVICVCPDFHLKKNVIHAFSGDVNEHGYFFKSESTLHFPYIHVFSIALSVLPLKRRKARFQNFPTSNSMVFQQISHVYLNFQQWMPWFFFVNNNNFSDL